MVEAEKKTVKKTAKKKTTTKKAASKTQTKKAATKTSQSLSLEQAQPELNIGLVGHVDHGKTTLTRSLSGKWTDTHSEELKHGITIRLGYADAIFYQNKQGEYSPIKQDGFEPVRKVSFIDAPGHESLMATMLAGSMIMDGALLLISANESCPQAQTREHLSALEMCGIKNVIVVQNKIDLVSPEEAKENYEQIKAFLKNSSYKDAPVIPISAEHKINIDSLIQAIQEQIPTPQRSDSKDPFMLIARSFDVNKPGAKPGKLVGGILGGSLLSGEFNIGDTIEVRPGYVYEKKNQQAWKPYQTTITGLMSGKQKMEKIVPGGSVAILTQLDPSIVKSDKLTGHVVGHPDKLPPVWSEFNLKIHLLERMVGSDEEKQVEPIRKMEPLMLNVNSATTVGIVANIAKGVASCKLKLPVCAAIGARVTISRRVGNRFRLIGYGIIQE